VLENITRVLLEIDLSFHWWKILKIG